jgi:type I restriction enzyme S subunit
MEHNIIPEGYKQTEVGVIPESWDVKSLGDCVEINSGDSPSKFELLNEGVPYYKVEQLNNGNKYADRTRYFIEPGKSKVIPKGSIIFPKRGASILLNKIRILKFDSFMDTNLMTLTCDDGLLSHYLFYCLTYSGLDSVADTTSIPQINNKHIIPFAIPFPELKEQTAIANALSDVDALIASIEKLITKKQAIKTATMQQLLTGKKRLPPFDIYQKTDLAVIQGDKKTGQSKGTQQTELGEIPDDWEVCDFGGVVNYIKGYPFKSAEYTSDGVRIIRVSDTTYDSIHDKNPVYISDSGKNQYKKWALKENDLIFSTVGSKPPMYDSLVGKAILVPKRFDGSLLNQNAVLIRSKSYSRELQVLLLNHFRTDRYIDYIEIIYRGNANQASITLENLFQFLLPLPSDNEEIKAISKMFIDMDKEIDGLQNRLSKTQQIKQGMMQELLTGKTRLPVAEL